MAMTLETAQAAAASPPRAVTELVRARPREDAWPATGQSREEVWGRLAAEPFAPACDNNGRKFGLGLLLDWLTDQPGATWQERWLASGADDDGTNWREIPLRWMRERGHEVPWCQESFFRAVHPALCADLVRPSLPWLITSSLRSSALVGMLAQHRDPTGFARLRERCATDPSVNTAAATRTAYRAAQILVAKGGIIADIVPGDVLEPLDIEAELRGTSVGATHLFYRVLHDLDVFDDQAPATLRELEGVRALDAL